MWKYLSVLMVTTLVACGGDKTTDSSLGDDDDDTTGCSNSILAQFPGSGDTDVYYKTDVRFSLAAADTTAVITVTDPSGATVNGSTTIDGTLVAWSGDDLNPSTAYNATLSYGCGDATVSWTTSSTGSPTSVDLTGLVYSLDVANGEWVEPPGIGDLLAVEMEDTEILVSPTDVSTNSITMIGAVGLGNGDQDLCTESLPFPAADFANPFFSLETPALDLDIEGYAFTIQDLVLSGAFAPDGSRIQGAVFEGFVDTRPLATLLGTGSTENAMCLLVETFGVSCLPCADSAPFCLNVYVDSVSAANLPGAAALVEVTADDVANNVNCPTTTPTTP